jgi:hypothetical protein
MPNLAVFSLREDGYTRALHMDSDSGKPDLLSSSGRQQFLEYVSQHEIQTLVHRIKLRKWSEEIALIGPDFSRKYGLHFLDGVLNMEPVVSAFWKTFHNTMYYFKNNEICDWSWVYPYADAPLIQDIIQYDESDSESIPLNYKIINQLQFILPKTSLQKANRRVVFKDEIYTETRHPWMKKYDWEMKPRISLPWNPIMALTEVYPL